MQNKNEYIHIQSLASWINSGSKEIHVTFIQGLGWFKHILFIEYTHKDICIQQKGCDKAMIQCGQVLGYSQSKYCHAVFCFLSY